MRPNPIRRRLALFALSFCSALPFVFAAEPDRPGKEDHVTPNVYLSVDKLPAGKTCKVAIVLDIKKGWHINANPAQPDFMRPTEISLKSKLGCEIAGVKYPAGAKLSLPEFDEPLLVYEGRAIIRGTLKVPPEAAGKTDELKVTVQFQACNDKSCLPPKKVQLTAECTVAAAGEEIKSVNEKLFQVPKSGE
jgi:DsbC/DsbD-like thiol-disulfide interchange protein